MEGKQNISSQEPSTEMDFYVINPSYHHHLAQTAELLWAFPYGKPQFLPKAFFNFWYS